MKRLVSMLLALIMCLSMFTLVACDDPVEQSSTTVPSTSSTKEEPPIINPVDKPLFELEEGETYDGSEVEIEFSHTMGESLRNVLDEYIAVFNEMYPNITINHSQVGGYDDVRDTVSKQIIAGTQPNIAYCYPDHVALYHLADAVVPLDQFINSTTDVTAADGSVSPLGMTQAQIDDFIAAYWEEGRCYGDGVMYTLPLSKSTEVLYYNKTYFEANNISVPKTWDELEAVCRQIIAIENNNNCIPLGYDSEANWFITMCEQLNTEYTSATGTKYLFNNEANQAFVKKFGSWYVEGLLTTQEIYGAYTSGMFVNMDKSKTYSYMSIGSSAGASHQVPTGGEFEVGIVPIPQSDLNNQKVISQGPSLVILNNENRQEVIASYLFVEFLTTCVEFQADFSMASGYIPVIKSVENDEIYSKWLNGGSPIATSVKVGLEQKDNYYVSPAFSGSSVARDEVGNIIQNVFIDYLNYASLDDNGNVVYDHAGLDAMIDTKFADAIAICERKYPSEN